MIADILSLSRILLGILFVIFGNNKYLGLGIIAIAGLTDIFDGIVSRKFKKSKYGYIIDPVSDKFFVLIVIVGLIINYKLNILYAILLLSRDIINGIILPLIYLFKKIKEIPSAKFLGKLTTIMLFITFAAVILNFYSLEFIFATIGLSIFTALYSLVFNFPKS